MQNTESQKRKDCIQTALAGWKSVTGEGTASRIKWRYVGDVNIEYGGAFFDLTDWDNGYVPALRVTDLDSGCGFDGAVLIEKITVLIDDNETNKRAANYCGFSLDDIDTSTDDGKLRLAEAVMQYGRFDPANEYYEPQDEVVQTFDDGPMEFDGWKATKRVLSENLQEYIENKLD